MRIRYSPLKYEEILRCVNKECPEYGASWVVMCRLELGSMCAINDEDLYCSECEEYGE